MCIIDFSSDVSSSDLNGDQLETTPQSCPKLVVAPIKPRGEKEARLEIEQVGKLLQCLDDPFGSRSVSHHGRVDPIEMGSFIELVAPTEQPIVMRRSEVRRVGKEIGSK